MADKSTRRRFLTTTGAIGATALAGCAGLGDDGSTPTDTAMDDSMTETTEEPMMTDTMTDEGMMDTEFTVTVENVSTAETIQTMEGPRPGVLAPVAYVLHEDPGPIFVPGEAASPGLEILAEDGGPGTLVEELSGDGFDAGAQPVPKGADEPGPIGPGGAYEFTVTAHPGQNLSLATMFVQSNDLFYAPAPSGLSLWTDGEPISGDQTNWLALWDAGTEVNQEPGTGADQAPRQSGPDTGESEGGIVRRIGNVDDGFTYPAHSEVIKLTVAPGGMDG